MSNQTESQNDFEDSILKKSTILYLEDDDVIRKETLSILEKFFKTVFPASNGQEGLDLYQSNKDTIDIVLTDINMPIMDGIQFMEALRQKDEELPVLIITAFNDVKILIKAIKLNVTDYIVKPMQLNITLKTLEKILQNRYNQKLVIKQNHELEIYKDILDKENLVTETDLNGIITYVNDIFCEVSGYSRKQLIGANHNIVRHPDTSPKVFEELWKTIQNKKVWKGKLKNKTKDRSDYYVQATIFPILDEDGNIEKYVSSKFVITEQEEEKHKLKKYILQQKSQQVKHEKMLQGEFEYALNVATLQKNEQLGKLIHELNEQVKTLRAKNADDKGRILSLEKNLKESSLKTEDKQKVYQEKIEKLHKTAVVASEQYHTFKKKYEIISEKYQKSQEGIVTFQGYIDEYRHRIKELEDLILAYEKQFGPLTVKS